jgi:zinc transporter
MNAVTDNPLLTGLTVFHLDGAGSAREVSPTEVERLGAEQGPLWIHVNFSDAAGVHWLRHDSNVDEVISDALLEDESRPRSLLTEAGVLVILRGVKFNPGSEYEDMISVRIWVEKDRVITASRRRLKSIEDLLEAFDCKRGPETPFTLLMEIIDRIGFYIAEVIERLEDTLETVETDINDTGTMIRNSPFSVLRRQTARIRRYLAPQRDALERISRMAGSMIDQGQVFDLREQVNRFTLLLEDLDLIRERAMVAQEEFLGILAHEQNNRMLVLSIVAAVFLPLSFVTGLMGMNVAGLPGTENKLAFAILIVLMLMITGFIIAMFKARKWF